jgi:hypothetical protein
MLRCSKNDIHLPHAEHKAFCAAQHGVLQMQLMAPANKSAGQGERGWRNCVVAVRAAWGDIA